MSLGSQDTVAAPANAMAAGQGSTPTLPSANTQSPVSAGSSDEEDVGDSEGLADTEPDESSVSAPI